VGDGEQLGVHARVVTRVPHQDRGPHPDNLVLHEVAGSPVTPLTPGGHDRRGLRRVGPRAGGVRNPPPVFDPRQEHAVIPQLNRLRWDGLGELIDGFRASALAQDSGHQRRRLPPAQRLPCHQIQLRGLEFGHRE
jgi:hypothetical protein